MQAYCLKCRTQRDMKDPKPVTMKNGKPATSGACPFCKTETGWTPGSSIRFRESRYASQK